jgi:hypothetical protein
MLRCDESGFWLSRDRQMVGTVGHEGSFGSDCWADRWDLRQWQFGLVAWVSERGWLGLEAGRQT